MSPTAITTNKHLIRSDCLRLKVLGLLSLIASFSVILSILSVLRNT